MDTATLQFVANFLAKKCAAYIAASLVTIGALHSGSDETQFITMISGVIVGVLAFVWSWWNDRGKQKVLAELAKAHKVAPANATVAAASKAIVASVNDNKVVSGPSGIVKIASALVFGVLVYGAAFPAHAAAQTAPTTSSLATAVNGFMTSLQSTNADIIKNTVAALTEADQDAASQVNGVVKDPIAHACYPAQIQYLQSLPTAQPIAVPAPYNLIVLFQYKRDFVNLLLSGQLIPAYLKVGCSALLGNEAAIFAATVGAIGVAPAIIGPITAWAGSVGAAAVAFPLLAPK